MFKYKNIVIAVFISFITVGSCAKNLEPVCLLEPSNSIEEIAKIKEHLVPWYAQDLLESGCCDVYAQALESAKEEIFHETTFENYYFYIKCNEKTIGYLWCDQVPLDSEEISLGEVYLQSLYIKPEYRGKGIGTYVMGQFEDICRRKKVHSIGLYVFAKSEAAINLYQKMGYETIKILAHENGEHIGFYMLKELNI